MQLSVRPPPSGCVSHVWQENSQMRTTPHAKTARRDAPVWVAPASSVQRAKRRPVKGRCAHHARLDNTPRMAAPAMTARPDDITQKGDRPRASIAMKAITKTVLVNQIALSAVTASTSQMSLPPAHCGKNARSAKRVSTRQSQVNRAVSCAPKCTTAHNSPKL